MKIVITASKVLVVLVACICLSAGVAAGDCCNSSTTDPSNIPPSKVIFTGETEQNVPCTFNITLSSTDTDGTVEGFEYTGSLPAGYGLSGNIITGPTLNNNCGPDTFTSSWVAVDDDDAQSTTSASLTLKCNERPNLPPGAPTYSISTTLTKVAGNMKMIAVNGAGGVKCSFRVTLHSTDDDGWIRAYEMVGGTLPPGYTLDGHLITGGLVDPGEWISKFRAHDNDCEPGEQSQLTLTCPEPL